MIISLLQVCLDESNPCEIGGTRLLCRSMLKKPKMIHTRIEGSTDPRLEVMQQGMCVCVGGGGV